MDMKRPRAYRTPGADKPVTSRRQIRSKAAAIGLTEAHVEQTITEFMELDGWRSFKMEAVSERGFVARVMAKVKASPPLHQYGGMIGALLRSCMRAQGVGEPGMPDRLFVRYLDRAKIECPTVAETMLTVVLKKPAAEILWIEFKRPGERPRPDQTAWHEQERARGALVYVVDDIDEYIAWYKASGLQRR